MTNMHRHIGLGERINELVVEFGSLQALAKGIGEDAGYLSRLRSGEKTNPSDEVLLKLGLRKVTLYERMDIYNPREQFQVEAARRAKPPKESNWGSDWVDDGV